jgi:two-component system cell cycle sensor histidine kinase/response regulator CckA
MRRLMNLPADVHETGGAPGLPGRLPPLAALYCTVVVAAAVVAAVAVTAAEAAPASGEWIEFAILLPLAALAPLFTVSIARNHGFHTGAAFVVAGALVLPPALVVALALLLRLPTWFKERAPWYVETFNVANSVLSALAAALVAHLLGTQNGVELAVAGLAAAAVFVLLNHVLLAVMLWLGRGLSLRETGLFSSEGFGIEFVIALLGVAVAALADTNAWLLPALLAPFALGHRSLSTLALLRESEERFRTMFESGPTATMLLAIDGSVLAVNRSLESMLGYTADELRSLSIYDHVHPDDREAGADLYLELVRGEREAYRRDAVFVTKDGRTVLTQLAAALVRDADGKPTYVIGMAEDVTEQKQLEEQLRQSQKLEAVGRLAGGVAHDFNNMLTAIGGYTSFALERAPAGSPLRSDLDEVRKATERAALLTRQLLAFSRKQVLQPEVLDLNTIVAELESMLRPLLGEEVRLTTRLDPALGAIEADPGQLQQVVMNLVVNARDAMPAGGPISIETANADIEEAGDGTIEPGSYVTLTVRDEGEGIDEATIGQIFEPFFTTKDAGKGTGLGLATVYGIVKQSGGYLSVETELGAGSAFTIYLHRVAAMAGPTPAPEPAPEPEPVAGTAAAATVLVVEDEEVVRSLVHQVLEGDGYRVLVANDGEEAVVIAAADDVQLLVTDLSMPKLGGRELAEALRAANPGLKVLYMSGYAESGILSDGVLPPGTAFIGKPFTLGELTDSVRDLLAV